jgi:hypothetical protein
MQKRVLQYKKCQNHNQGDKWHRKQRKETHAIKSHLQIPEEKTPPPPTRLTDFALTFRADITNLVAVTDGKIAFHGRHSHLVIEIITAF